MVAVVIDRPLGEDDIGVFLLYDLPKLLEMRGVQDGVPVDLSRKGGACLEYSGGLGGLCRAHARGRASLFFRPLAIVEMKKNHLVTKFSEPGNGAPAAVFSVSGMPARYDNLELF